MKLPGVFQDTSPGKCEGSPFPLPWWQEQLHVGLIQGGAWGCVVVMEGMRHSECPGRSPREWLSGPSAGLGELRKLPTVPCNCDPLCPCFLFPSEAVQPNPRSRSDPERSPQPLVQAFILGLWVPGPQNPKGQERREAWALQGCPREPIPWPLGRNSYLSKREPLSQESLFLLTKVPGTVDQGL